MFEWLVLVSGTVWEGLGDVEHWRRCFIEMNFGVPKVFASVSPSAPSVYLSPPLPSLPAACGLGCKTPSYCSRALLLTVLIMYNPLNL